MASISSSGNSSSTRIECATSPPESDEFDPVDDWDDLDLPARDDNGVWEHVYENGRRYHLYKYGRYPIPNDETEQQREDMKHAMMLELTDGKLYHAPIGNDPRKIIDIGTGTGIWAIEMGDKFPDAQVLGTDLSPIQPEWIPENVRFMIDDCEAAWANGGDWDFAHLRQIAGVITDPEALIKRTYEHLKPGGWIEFQEIHAYPFCDDGTMDMENDPILGFYDMFIEALENRGMNHDKMRALRGPLTRAGFTNITLIKKKIPLGPWAKDKTLRLIGQYLKMALLELVPSVMIGPLADLGLTQLEREVWSAKIRQSLDDIRIHRHFHFYFWYAQRPKHS